MQPLPLHEFVTTFMVRAVSCCLLESEKWLLVAVKDYIRATSPLL